MQIVNLFYELAREHRDVKAFIYGKAYEKGSGNEAHPLVWLDDPVLGQSISIAVLRYTVNVDFLDIPVNDSQVLIIQETMFKVGLAFIERLNSVRSGAKVESFSFLSLRDYYDNNAAGYRFTYQLSAANPVNRCADVFDINKVFPSIESLPDFSTENPGGCAIFSNKLGTFNV